MSEDKFTKGPWYRANYSARAAQTGKFIAHADNNSVDDVERKANAELIAAAPEMYEMLEDCMCHLFNNCCDEESKELIKKIIELRKKARGE